MSVLALIPARGGSKGVPRKNLRLVGGRSLVARAVHAALESGVADHVVVSTDDEEIAEEAIRAGAEVPFMRPAELADDQAPMVPVVEHAIREFERIKGIKVETLVFLEATEPFRRPEHIVAAMERYRQGDCGSVLTVCPLERKPQYIFIKREDGLLERYIKEPREFFTRRQDMKHLCRLSSGARVVGRDGFFRERSLAVEPIGYVEVSGMHAVNIDEELDFLVAEMIAERYGW